MQTVETLNEGLKRAYTLTIDAAAIEARVDAEVKKTAPQVRMPGFRPGKVPANLVRKMHGEAIQADALNNAVQEGVQALISEKALRPAMSPSVELNEDYAHGKDAELKIALEVLPEVPMPNVEGLKLERLTVEATDAAIDASVQQIASIEIGSGRLIPGFEDQLVGVKANDSLTINVTFPDTYSVAYLEGKAATFDIVVNEIRTPKTAVADEEFAKSLGLESLEQLRNLLKGQVEQETAGLTRIHMKRRLLDQLAASHDFEVPPSMVEAEFGQIWQQLEHEASHEADPEAALADMEKEKAEYSNIAVRRVRLGLLLSEIGRLNNIEISNAEMSRLIQQAASQYGPEDRDRFIQYVQQDPMASAQLRAPLYEDKVVDFLFEKADITDRAVTREELEAAIEAEEDGHVHGPGCGHDHDHDHAPKAKAKAKKPAAEKAEVAEKPAKVAKAPAKKAKAEDAAPVAEEKPLKKAAAKKAK
jgi:trigger factor